MYHWGRFCVIKATILDGPEHFLTPSAHRDTHLFGGLGLRRDPPTGASWDTFREESLSA